jgi:nucleoside phosphorylase
MGTIFEVGVLPDARVRVALAITGPGNTAASVLAERGLSTFKPAVLLFVGIAGALRDDLSLGDVVVATHVCAHHGGREEEHGFRARPRVWQAPHDLDQLARHVARTRGRVGSPAGDAVDPLPRVHFGPVVSGEVVLNSRGSPTAERIRLHYDDAVAIEMESAGAAHAAHLNGAQAMVVRGISDFADGTKDGTDRSGWRRTAAGNAAEFALALIASLPTVASTGRSIEDWVREVNQTCQPYFEVLRALRHRYEGASTKEHVVGLKEGSDTYKTLIHSLNGVELPSDPHDKARARDWISAYNGMYERLIYAVMILDSAATSRNLVAVLKLYSAQRQLVAARASAKSKADALGISCPGGDM